MGTSTSRLRLITAFLSRKKLGEAKIYDGPEYHIEGLSSCSAATLQAAKDAVCYCVCAGREHHGLVTKLRETMDVERPCKQTATPSTTR